MGVEYRENNMINYNNLYKKINNGIYISKGIFVPNEMQTLFGSKLVKDNYLINNIFLIDNLSVLNNDIKWKCYSDIYNYYDQTIYISKNKYMLKKFLLLLKEHKRILNTIHNM
jgi:predicted PolB exonuclease-like 3'-5' exonuclease